LSAHGGDGPEIAIVIPAYRAAATIGRCVAGLRSQTGAPRCELVLVDSSPDESTAEAVASANPSGSGAVDLRIVRSVRRLFPGVARNAGAEVTRAPWLLFLDADCIASPDLLARAARARSLGAVAVGGSIARAGPFAVSARVRHLLEFKESLPGVPAGPTWKLPSACLLIERSAFERHGRFPETRASEDWLLNWRMWQAGCPMRFEPTLRVAHLTPAGWREQARYARLLGFWSGRARRVGGLPGQAVVRWPPLALGLPVARTLRALAWTARYAPGEFGFLLAAWPAYLAVCSIWALGFYAGVRAGDDSARLG
jgi:GT2 family glycosyltransferase